MVHSIRYKRQWDKPQVALAQGDRDTHRSSNCMSMIKNARNHLDTKDQKYQHH